MSQVAFPIRRAAQHRFQATGRGSANLSESLLCRPAPEAWPLGRCSREKRGQVKRVKMVHRPKSLHESSGLPHSSGGPTPLPGDGAGLGEFECALTLPPRA